MPLTIFKATMRNAKENMSGKPGMNGANRSRFATFFIKKKEEKREIWYESDH